MPFELTHISAHQLLELPRRTTVFFFPVGPLEDHGPHLPLGLDLAEAHELCRRAGERVEREMPGWRAIVMPVAPLGISADTQDVALTVRGYVLRDWLVDACRGLERAGFFHFGCISGNLGPRQLTAIEEAGKLVRKRTRWIRLARRIFAGRNTERDPLPSLFSVSSGQVTAADVRRSPLFLDPREHGGRRDTSVALALDTALVAPSYATLPERPPANPSHWARARMHWLREISGYWGKPAEASAAWGEGVLKGTLDEVFPKIRAVLEGADPNLLFRSWYSILPPNRSFFTSWLLFAALTSLLLLWVYVSLRAVINGTL